MPGRTAQDLQQDMENSKQTRTSEKQRLLHRSYDAEIARLESELRAAVVESRTARRDAVHGFVERLAVLIERKAGVEKGIWRLLAEIRAGLEQVKREVLVVVEGRAGDLGVGIERVEGVDADADVNVNMNVDDKKVEMVDGA